MRAGALFLTIAAAAALVWSVSGELAWPARAYLTFLLVPLPMLLILQARLIGDPAAIDRIPAYLSSAVALWVLALIALAAARASDISRYALGLVMPLSWTTQLAWTLALVGAATGLMYAAHALGIRETELLAHLLPRNTQERIGFIGLSLTAGICEELVFRGFLITALTMATGSLLIALGVSSLAFGVVHAYQDPNGVARATLLGMLLAAPYVLTGSLAAPILAHSLIDIIGGLYVGPRLTRS